MGNKSAIETELSTEDRKELNRKIGSGTMTIDALTDWLAALGYEISRSSMGRHKKKVDIVGERLRQSRQLTDALVAEIGDSAAQGKQGRLLVEMTRNIVFDLLMKIQDEDEKYEIDSKDVAMLGKGLAELGKALRLDQDFEEKIRDRIEKEVSKRAADTVGETMKEAGLDDEQIQFWREEFLGIKTGVKKSPDDS
jgi:hypothetical protein